MMSTQANPIIDVSSDEESSLSVAAAHIRSGKPRTSEASAMSTVESASKNRASILPHSRILAGKTFAFRGMWLTMTTGAAEELCKVNGGEVSLAIAVRTQYVVMGGKGTTQNTKKFTEYGAKLITEAEFLQMILVQTNPEKENMSISPSSGHKRSLEDPSSGPSKPAKARKSDPVTEEEDLKWVHAFLRSDEIRLHGKTLVAYDCGGEVFKAQRGKSVIDLLRKFNEFLEDCQGEYR